ncbi:2,3-dihydro-2,3-dihydroxybenzoate dehydrogenase [Nocardiopsis ganjiahuensis]|uniref:2,3-dihydro-2,3-dihydroxybenzoate dehydrogenase n=1 Tax=Nocardiopsis ganjiahuensis TaxID=239984 RepID=UPI0003490B91|nr:2,3-dihydro-2,3-dihydroxybenzoate dehydrogenase [Nocardiopsis ganjiahuensis]
MPPYPDRPEEPDRSDQGVALVTGAAGGIGAAVVRRMAAEGYAVAAIDRREAPSRQLVAELGRGGHRAVHHGADVSDGDAVERVVSLVERDLGPITAVANVAGVLRHGLTSEFPPEHWHELFAVNALGVFNVCRAVSSRMVPRGHGSIVTVGSDAASVPRVAMAAYAASKAAATQFTLCFGLETAPSGIRCNVVSPGSTDTPMRRQLWGDDTSGGAPAPNLTDFRVGVPLGRVADPEDVADAVAFLLSPRARHITLHDLRVDGGASLGA